MNIPAELLAKVELAIDQGDITTLRTVLDQLQPFDIAEILEELSQDRQITLIDSISPEVAAEAIVYLEPIEQYRIFDGLPEKKMKTILELLSSDDVVDLVAAIHPHQAERLVGWLPQSYLDKIRALMSYPENTAGSLATFDYISARESWTASQTLAHIRKVGNAPESISYVYVLDARGHLVGVASLRSLIMAPPEATLAEFIDRSVVSIDANEHQERAAQLLSQYDWLALPVIEASGRMVGIITVDDIIDVIEAEVTEDFQLGAAVTPLEDDYGNLGVWELYKKRAGWLVILVFINLLSSSVMAVFEELLAATIALTFFVPLLIATGGNAGQQSSTLMVRSLATGDTQLSQWFKVLLKELGVGLSLGVTLGLASWVLGVVQGGLRIGLVVSLSMTVIVVIANLVGVTMPFVLTKLKKDPAVASGPLLTTIVDVAGLLIYLSIAKMLL